MKQNPFAGPLPSASPQTAALLQATDWDATELGPRGRWPQSLSIALSICLNSRFPMFVWWGESLFNFYNDAYIPVLGARHPHAFGRPAAPVWPEIWPVVGPQAEQVMRHGEATWNQRVPLLMERNGFAEETWFTWSYSPIPDEHGDTGGLFCACTEDTHHVLLERRLQESEANARSASMVLHESESRFRKLADHAPVMIWVTRPDAMCEYLNARWYEFSGQSAGEALGFGWLNAVHPDDKAVAEKTFLDANARHLPFSLDYRLRDRRGEYRWCIDSAQPRFDDDGAFLGYVGSVIDITDRKREETATAAEKRALELIATGSPLEQVLDAIVRGAEAQSAHGLRASILVLDAVGKHLRVAASPSLPAGYNAAFDGLAIGAGMGTCGTAAHERRVVTAADLLTDPSWAAFRGLAAEYRLGACCSMPIIGPDDRLYGTVELYYDRGHVPSEHDAEIGRSATRLAGIVLEKHRQAEQLEELLAAEQAARSQAERASHSKDEFLATLSHELRTPLNSILGWVAILRMKGRLPDDAMQGVQVIERNARAQAQIIEDLLDMSAIISGKIVLDVQRLDLREAVLLAVETARPTAAGKQVDLRIVDSAHGETLEVLGDDSRLQQVLWNLLSNAVKFSSPGGRIEALLARTAHEAMLSIKDNGAGIEPDFLPFVFDRFRQADASPTRRHGGLGLGLSVVKRLVELHGGAVEVDSKGLGQGACFTVRLPLPDVARLSLDRGRGGAFPLAATGEGMATTTAPVELSGLEVLLVDDDGDGRLMTQRLLEHAGAVVTPAESAATAMSLLRGRRFDVLVSDIGMPETDGYAFMRQVRMLDPEQSGAINSVALSAYARPQDKARALAAGFQLHVAKPVEPSELISAVATVTRLWPSS